MCFNSHEVPDESAPSARTDVVLQMRDAHALGHLGVVEHDRRVAKVVEERDAIPEQHRHQVDPDDVKQP